MELVEQTPNFFVLVRRNSPNRWVNLFSRSNYVARCRGFWKEDRLQLSLKGPGWSGPYFWLHSAGFLGGIHLALARQQWVTGTIVFGIAMALLLCSVKIFPPIRKSFHRDVLEFLKS
ncbi:MAG: hypothetical protein CMN76_12580 [Spirochaetaceae bacterium]|nr:hypothetical protein [Spirochaetaceae bacterium]